MTGPRSCPFRSGKAAHARRPVVFAYELILALTRALEPMPAGGAAVAAIVLFTTAVRTLLLPFGIAAARGERARARLTPRIRKVQRRHGADPRRLRRELAALYREEGVSPAAGCLPTLAQMPFFYVMYRLFTSTVMAGHQNALLAHTLFGAPLGQNFICLPAGHDGLDIGRARHPAPPLPEPRLIGFRCLNRGFRADEFPGPAATGDHGGPEVISPRRSAGGPLSLRPTGRRTARPRIRRCRASADNVRRCRGGRGRNGGTRGRRAGIRRPRAAAQRSRFSSHIRSRSERRPPSASRRRAHSPFGPAGRSPLGNMWGTCERAAADSCAPMPSTTSPRPPPVLSRMLR